MKIPKRYYATAISGTVILILLGGGITLAHAEEQHNNHQAENNTHLGLPTTLKLKVPSDATLFTNNSYQQRTNTIADAEALKFPTRESSSLEELSPSRAQGYKNIGEERAQQPLPFSDVFETTEHSFSKSKLVQSFTEKRAETLQSSSNDKKDWPSPVKDNQLFYFVLLDQFEFRAVDGPNTLNWDAIGWVGGDFKRFWFEIEGDIGLSENSEGEVEIQALYGQLVSPFWDFQAGLRYDRLYGSGPDQGRAFGVIGIQGLAPYLFEVDASLFVSEDGDVSARLTAEYDLLLTQRLILQPRAELNLAAQRVEGFEVGSGLSDIELGLRLRYEINRKLAPYVGINWERRFFETAELAREEDESVGDFSVLAGIRLLF